MARRVASRGPQRQFIWSDILTHLMANTFLTKTISGVSNQGLQSGGGLTLIRSRGRYNVHFDPTSVADTVQVGLGLMLITDDAFAIGSTAAPGPISDADYDWIWYQLLLMGPAFTATESGNDLQQNTGYMELDSKAMRKIKPNQTLCFAAEGLVINGGGTIDVTLTARHLFKLG